jgi:hypothetical protein
MDLRDIVDNINKLYSENYIKLLECIEDGATIEPNPITEIRERMDGTVEDRGEIKKVGLYMYKDLYEHMGLYKELYNKPHSRWDEVKKIKGVVIRPLNKLPFRFSEYGGF